jgi:Tfp pilus assembly protein PilN
MIKINLIKTKVTRSAVVPGATEGEGNVNFDSADDQKVAGLIKIVLMVVFIAGAMFYRSSQIDALNEEALRTSQEFTNLQAEFERKRQESAAKPELEAQARALNDKLTILRNLSRLRLIEVKSLDYLQSVIPERVWFKTVTYASHEFKLVGFATTEEEISKFVKSLESNSSFKDVILLQSREEKGVEGKVRAFEISFRVESPS